MRLAWAYAAWAVCFAVYSVRVMGGIPPATMNAFECAVARLAFTYATARVPATAKQSVYDALNVAYLCNTSHTSTGVFDDAASYAPTFSKYVNTRALAEARHTSRPHAPLATFFVATTGDDSNPGTQQQPFATLARAAAAARAVPGRTSASGVSIMVRGGAYYSHSSALLLDERDSNVTWSAFPGEIPVLSGATLLPPLAWNPYKGPIVVANVSGSTSIYDERAQAWARLSNGRAGPPPLVSSLFINGVRQVRARYPNGNPDDETGICFSATQRPGEGCNGYSSCTIKNTGTQPNPNGVRISGIGPNRGDSPTLGCPQCNNCPSFEYTIYPYPPDHPVYTDPLPGVGWGNNSLFSFWASPFARPAGAVLGTAGCDPHWNSALNYSHPEVAVVHMFHASLWGGWQFALDNVTVPASEATNTVATMSVTEADIPTGTLLWFKADTISGVADGSKLSTWPDSSGNGHDATQNDAAVQPTYNATCPSFGGKPCIVFNGVNNLLRNDDSALIIPSDATIIAVFMDTGSVNTDSGSGVFFTSGSRHGLGTLVRKSAGPQGADDDPVPAGRSENVIMADWNGSGDMGHRNVLNKPISASVVYSTAGVTSYVLGCAETTEGAQSETGTGFMVGSRNNEMMRYFKGPIAELLVYPRALSNAERQSVEAYLATKWALPAQPRTCGAPTNQVALNFGYGGYQEARGADIRPGVHFYIENVLEELDVPGEWYFDAAAGQLYLYPNVTLQPSIDVVAFPVLDAVIVINGSQTGPGMYATGISFNGFTFTQTRTTFLEMYEVPSGGDWSIHRGGAVFVQDASSLAFTNCTWSLTGGNGLFFSNHVSDSLIADNEFAHIGDSAIAFIGSTVSIDGSGQTYPRDNTVSRNHIHETGIYGKQTSCFVQSVAANTSLLDNVCYNTPRAGFNFNDGFGGGNIMMGNLAFNHVRETGDHGPFNSWDRQPYWTLSGVNDGFNDPAGRSFLRAEDVITRNFLINGYNGVWSIDHDDCSQFYDDRANFMVFGGCKNYIGDSKMCRDNVITYPGTDGRSAGNRRCQTDDNGQFANSYHTNNTCISADGQMYSWSNCNDKDPNSTVFATAGNTLYSDPGSTLSINCGSSAFSLEQWQALGQDAGSTEGVTPTIQEIMALGAAVLAG